MREIKFRAWDGVDYMSKPFDLFSIQRKEISFTQDAVLMQYTGLKDKNGVEIYEGDVVKYTTNYYNNLKEDNLRVIKWEDDMEHDGFGCPLATGFLLRGYAWEVIGNVYQNPELLDHANS